ncbi:MAG: hemerythrin domain-containing protein [Dehalococcoidia bacterium]
MTSTLPEPLAGLVREHRVVEDLLSQSRQAVAPATAAGATGAAIARALEQARDLQAFASVDLTLHIAKEEEVLFPAIRTRADSEMKSVIDDMIAQHDEIREGERKIRQLLASLDADHEEVHSSAASLSRSLDAAEREQSPSSFTTLYSAIRNLDAILQGHFLDEEENVLETVSGWFDAETLGGLTEKMEQLETRFS